MICLILLIIILLFNCYTSYKLTGGQFRNLYGQYSFDNLYFIKDNINNNKLLKNIVSLTSMGCTRDNFNNTEYHDNLKTKNKQDLHKICQNSYESSIIYSEDINQQICCKPNTICLPKCKKTADESIELDNIIRDFLNVDNKKKTKQSLTKIENYLINHRRKLNNDLNKIKPILTNYISIYKEMYNIYFSKFLKNNDY